MTGVVGGQLLLDFLRDVRGFGFSPLLTLRYRGQSLGDGFLNGITSSLILLYQLQYARRRFGGESLGVDVSWNNSICLVPLTGLSGVARTDLSPRRLGSRRWLACLRGQFS